MGITLEKGGRISLSKESPGLTKIFIGLGWDERATDGTDFDLDASVFLLNAAGKARSEQDFIFYNNLKGANGAVEHMGDNLTGGGDGDDEVIRVDLGKLESMSPDVVRMAVVCTIYDAERRRQNFGQVNNAFIRVVNDENNQEVVRFDLTEDYSTETAMVFGELYKKDGEWRFTAVGQGYAGGLGAACITYGLNAG
ncbi:MAG: tellurium resistance protein TerD [Candidatus Electronema aureum]|uniref:Tellurium resistance protein TerD n=1 Tax=Candidatus Electronema aureum TaxID=2005002 RepID=A0A521G4B9_9BACT|nr:MAG: tellurium resistance protein TerD [Candidatus Electronema aureum]